MTLLIADNDRDMVKLLRFILADEGYDIDVAYSGAETIKKLNSKEYPLILLDYDLQDMTGLDILSFIRDRNISTKVIMISGHTKSELKSRAYNMGVMEFIPKPFEIKTVLDNVHHVSESLSAG